MPSPRTRSAEKLDGVSLPYGSETVVSVKRRSKHGNSKIQPLSINTGDIRTISTSEGDLTVRRSTRREKRHYPGIYEDPKTHRMSLYNSHRKLGDIRKSNVRSSVLLDSGSDRRRVISCMELNVPELIDLNPIPVEHNRNGDRTTPTSVPVFADARVNQGTFVFPRDPTKVRTPREREVHASIRTEEETPGIRYSGVFAPELVRSRLGSRHRLRKSRSSHFYPSPSTPIWSPFVPVPMNFCSNCMTPTCQRCHNSVASPRKSYSQDIISGTPYPSETMDMRGSQYFDLPPKPPSPYVPQHHHRQHHNHYQQQQQQARQRMSSYYSGSRLFDVDRGAYMPSRSNLLNTSVEEVNGYGFESDRMVDLLEIEYASINDEQSATQLSPKRLNLIVTLAREAVGATDELESMARNLKLELDQQLGEKWHVVIGTDSFGSNLASLPGALVNFKVDKYVILAWQT